MNKLILVLLLLQGCVNVSTYDIVTVNVINSEIKPEVLTKKEEVKSVQQDKFSNEKRGDKVHKNNQQQ